MDFWSLMLFTSWGFELGAGTKCALEMTVYGNKGMERRSAL
jgi:hypothetical protein